jgi:glycosyltransferase involved in cell wall biosynthesis
MHGKITLAHGTRVVIEALGLVARRVADVHAIMFDSSKTVSDGFGPEQLMKAAHDAGAAEAIELHPLVSLETVSAMLRRCDVGIVAYDRNWGVNSLPNKLFEYMGAGLAVIAPTYSREIRSIIERERCGLLVDCERPLEIAEALEYLHTHRKEATDMGRRGREAFLARHNWTVEARPLVDRIIGWADGARLHAPTVSRADVMSDGAVARES